MESPSARANDRVLVWRNVTRAYTRTSRAIASIAISSKQFSAV
nr:hypothetical protein [Sphingomonas sp. PL-96]